jgi:hypothetical protein
MSVPKHSIKALKQKILKSFDNASYPNESIAPHECEECRAVRKSFKNQNWKTITPQILEENYGIIPLFSPEAFRYFLPAYVIYSLDHFDEYGTVCEFTIYALTPDNQSIKDRLDYWQEKFADFTLEQMNCIYEFLDFVRIDENFQNSVNSVSTGRRNLEEFIEPILRK